MKTTMMTLLLLVLLNVSQVRGNDTAIKSGWNWNPTPKSWETIDLNNFWKFKHMGNSSWREKDDLSDSGIKDKFYMPGFDDAKWKDIPVPWTWNMEYGHCDKRLNLYGVCWYRKNFNLKEFDSTKEKVLLEFKGIVGVPMLWINGKSVPILNEAGHYFFDKDKKNSQAVGMLRQFVDVTPFAQNGRNMIALRIFDSRKWNSRAKPAGLVNGVFVRITPKTYFDYVLVTPGKKKVKVDLYSGSDTAEKFSGTARIFDAESKKVIGDAQVNGELKKSIPFEFSVSVAGQKMWSPDNPNLYFLSVSDKSGNEIARERFGFRTMRMKNGDLYFNDKRFKAIGGRFPAYFNSRFRYGRNSPKPRKTSSCNENNFAADRIAIAKKANFRISRGGGGGYSDTFVNLCDKMGYMLYFEMPRKYYQNKDLLRRIIFQFYNNPSVVIWEFGNEQFECWMPGITEQMNTAYDWTKGWDKQNRPISPTSGMTVDIKAGKADIVDLHHYFGGKENSLKMAEDYNKYIYNVIKKKYKDEPAFIFFEGPPLDLPTRQVVGFWNKVGLKKIIAIKDRTERKRKLVKVVSQKKLIHYQIRFRQSEEHFGSIAPNSYCNFSENKKSIESKMKEVYFERTAEFLRMYRRCPYLDGFSFGNCGAYDLITKNKDGKQIPNKTATLIERCYATMMVSLDPYQRNFFAGQEVELNAVIVNDSNSKDTFKVRCITRFGNGREMVVSESNELSVDSFAQGKTSIPFIAPSVKMPEHGWMIIALMKNGEEINRQEYRIMVAPHPVKITMPQKAEVALYSSTNDLFADLETANSFCLADILKELGVATTLVKDFKDLRKYNVFIIAPFSYDQRVVDNSASIKLWLKNGGKLLCLKQDLSQPIPWLNDAILDNVNAATWTSPVDMEHPVYRNLLPEDMRGPFAGNNPVIISKGFAPLLESFLAMNHSSRGWRASLLDEAVGNGQAIHCQLNIVERANDDIVSAMLLRNALDYLINGTKSFAVNSEKRAEKIKRFFSLGIDFAHFVNLRKHANMAFADETSGDRKGGWLDFGRHASFNGMPLGRKNFRGVLFYILDPANNNGKSMIALAGKPKSDVDRSYFPKEVTGLAVNAKLKRIFFLHASMYVTENTKGKEILQYVMHYKSGKTTTFRVIDGIDIADWHHPEDKKNALTGYIAEDHDDGLYIAEWKNPYPDDPIITIDIISAGGAIPGVVAITGERAK